MSIEVHISALGEQISHAGSNNLHLVKTKNRVDNRAGVVVGNKLLCHSASLGKSGLLHSNVNVVVHMTVRFHEVTSGHTKEEVLTLRSDFVGFLDRHILLLYIGLYFYFSTAHSPCQYFITTVAENLFKEYQSPSVSNSSLTAVTLSESTQDAFFSSFRLRLKREGTARPHQRQISKNGVSHGRPSSLGWRSLSSL